MRTIWWENGQVRMIDQRILPLEFEIVTYSDYRAVANSITDMVIRGAPAIGAAGAYGMALAAQQSAAADRDNLLADLETAKQVLDSARPTAVNLTWATRRLIELAYRLDLPDFSLSGSAAVNAIRSALLAEAERLADEDVAINRRMGANGATVIPHGANILHHCNTGSLAAVDYGTALGVVRGGMGAGQSSTRLGRRDPAASARRPAHCLGIDAGRHPDAFDRRQRRRALDVERQGRRGDLRRRSHRRQRRRGQ